MIVPVTETIAIQYSFGTYSLNLVKIYSEKPSKNGDGDKRENFGQFFIKSFLVLVSFISTNK